MLHPAFFSFFGGGVGATHPWPLDAVALLPSASADARSSGDVIAFEGHVGYCEDRGQPVLLPPGLHEFRSSTLTFKMSVDLNNTLILLGPYTVLTVDEGQQINLLLFYRESAREHWWGAPILPLPRVRVCGGVEYPISALSGR